MGGKVYGLHGAWGLDSRVRGDRRDSRRGAEIGMGELVDGMYLPFGKAGRIASEKEDSLLVPMRAGNTHILLIQWAPAVFQEEHWACLP